MHPLLKMNPFDVVLQYKRFCLSVAPEPAGFDFWIRSYNPPIRTVQVFIEKCPRLDWAIWFLNAAASAGSLEYPILDRVKDCCKLTLELVEAGYNRHGGVHLHSVGLNQVRNALVAEGYYHA